MTTSIQNKKKYLNVIVVDVPFHEGMAGTKRVKNLMMPLFINQQISLSNLALVDIFEKHKIGEKGSIRGIDYEFIGYTSFKKISAVLKFYRSGFGFIKAHLQNDATNIIYYYGYPDLKNIFFILYAKFKNCKILFDIVEDNRQQLQFLSFAGRLRNSTAIFLLKKVPYFGDGVIAISNTLTTWLNTLYKNKVEVYTIPITVETGKYDVVVAPQQANGFVTIFYGGSFADKDGLEYLLKAFNKVCIDYLNVRLILTGVGQPADMEKMEPYFKANHNIEYLGFLSTADYYAVLKKSDICCMTRNNSSYANAGFPFKLGEFLAAGKAIIATTVGDVPLYLKNNVNAFLIPPESVEAIAVALKTFIENKNELRFRLGREAQKTAKTYFDDTLLSNQLLQIFKEL